MLWISERRVLRMIYVSVNDNDILPSPFIYIPVIHLKVQPKDMNIVIMWWQDVSVKLQLSNYRIYLQHNNYILNYSLKT
jgi:hypothetical protein